MKASVAATVAWGSVLLGAGLAGCSAPAAASSLPLTQVQDITLPGAANRLDYQAFDAGAERLYIAHLGDGTVHAVDLDTGTVAGTVPGAASVHGVVLAPDRHLLLAAASGTNDVAIIDTETLAVTGRVPAGNTPNGIAYDPVHGKAYVSTDTVATRTGASPDVLAFDEGLHRLYVASESGVVSIFDEQDRAMVLKASGKLAENAHTVAVDQATHRVYFPLQDVNGHPVLRVMDPVR